MSYVIGFACTRFSMKKYQALGFSIKAFHQLVMKLGKAIAVVYIQVFYLKIISNTMSFQRPSTIISFYHINSWLIGLFVNKMQLHQFINLIFKRYISFAGSITGMQHLKRTGK